MTTIVGSYARREIAADSQWQAGDMKQRARKIYRVRGALIGIAGTVTEGLKFVQWYAEGCRRDEEPQLHADTWGALVLDATGLFEWNERLVPIPCYDKEGYSVGTGYMAAQAALKLGKTPKEAVEVACLIDINTGPPVVVEKL